MASSRVTFTLPLITQCGRKTFDSVTLGFSVESNTVEARWLNQSTVPACSEVLDSHLN
jgi:hypothetical protein